MRALIVAALLLTARCATSRHPITRRDEFPLDPREELTGPFADGTIRGVRRWQRGDAAAAESAFASARSSPNRRLAAEIGWIEAVVLRGRAQEALSACRTQLDAGDPTVPLLVACGEANARAGDAVEGHALYRQGTRARREPAGAERQGRGAAAGRARPAPRAGPRQRVEEAMVGEPCRRGAGDRSGAGIFLSARSGGGYRGAGGGEDRRSPALPRGDRDRAAKRGRSRKDRRPRHRAGRRRPWPS